MWPKLFIGVVAFKVMCSVVKASSSNTDPIPILPYCPNKNGSGIILVSTLDGKLSAINSSGHLSWTIETGPGPLLVSNIHKLELTNNGEWIKIIPSLTGNLYKFDGNTIDPTSISADKLLKSSFRYSDDMVFAGGAEVRTYGVGFHTGKLFYECTQKKCSSQGKEEMDDVVVIERSTQTIRAIEPRTGQERWNFSVGLHNVSLPQVSCVDTKLFESNVTAILPEGLVKVSFIKEERNWQYKFHSPIVKIWKWDGMKLHEVNLFDSQNIPGLENPSSNILPSIYVGMHRRQLYIQESVQMETILDGHKYMELMPAESQSIAKIPWKPIPASAESTEDDSTALSVLNNSEYVNGNGYYLYSEHAIENKNSAHCEMNKSKLIEAVVTEKAHEEEEQVGKFGFLTYVSSATRYYKEFLLMMATVVLSPFFLILWNRKRSKPQEAIITEKPVEASVPHTERQISEKSSEGFSSRFTDDFKLISCLGKGGFGVVFQVKQKYDDCDYAIKRITLPNEQKSRDRVMREVKALAKLDHKNIIRYFSSWVEKPPFGWEQEHDKNWIEPSFSEITSQNTSSGKKRSKSCSVSIDVMPTLHFKESFNNEMDLEETSEEDSFVVFENDESPNSINESNHDSYIFFAEESSGCTGNATVIAKEAIEDSNHVQNKINWKKPGRKHHSWDFTHNSIIMSSAEPPTYLYIQMQLCQKESLKDWLTSHYERNYKEMLGIFLQILDAVEYVHLRKLIHRDLKPSNIFFSLDGQIKVGDFGLVKDIESAFDLDYSRRSNLNNSYKGHTKEVGTTLYMSPEQSKGRIYDYKVDIYSLGIILFELLVPFNTYMERIKTLTDLKTQKFPQNFDKRYPAEYVLLQSMLDEDPSKRLTTIGIRARNPFTKDEVDSSSHLEDQHYSLNKFSNS
ncbi:hypothetical protein ABEB36_011082 [Hypothenemus hampei]|uniref:non-specific serine/threonine protein kinase n=1 Tax=Hypothenemus hampei TaxID=57062 RepID=A0ABD1EES6_HYPHA